MNLTSHSVNREIWVKPHGTDIYNDILNWTPHDWYVNICIVTDLYKMKLKLCMFGSKITRVSITICTTMENKRGEAWTHEETVLLIELWRKIDLFKTTSGGGLFKSD
jgi:hypothetical protein